MTGVSYMIPFVAAGGLLIALSFLFGGYEIVGPAGEIVVNNTLFNLPDPSALGLDHALFDSGFFAYVGAIFFVLGSTAFKFLVPALAGYIAYAIADRPGIAPGFVMGALAVDLGGFGLPQSGFLGGIIGGVMAGIVALWISRWKVAPWARGLMPVLLIPLLATLISGVVMIAVLSKPLGWLMDQLNAGLDEHERELRDRHPARRRPRPDDGLRHGRPAEQGRLLVRRRGSRGGGHGQRRRPRAQGDGRRDAGRHGAAAGPGSRDGPASRACSPSPNARTARPPGPWALSFITEGAIPFAAADPARVIPSIMLGSAVTGGLAMAMDVTLRAPHGGIFVLFAVGNILGFFIALVAGVIVAAVAVIALKSIGQKDTELATV